mmetsp:Transcript_17311/g.22522  ORF Transcript_17311/g.22522 Transcript_17311/m.22522 type:complete len:92 (-) Transcript_17311:237-512(-)
MQTSKFLLNICWQSLPFIDQWIISVIIITMINIIMRCPQSHLKHGERTTTHGTRAITRYTIATAAAAAVRNIAMNDAFQTGTAECMSTGCY